MPSKLPTGNFPRVSVCQVRYVFSPLSDVARAKDKDKVEVLGVCASVRELFEGTSRAGKPYKKREATLVDDNGAEVTLTAWGDKVSALDGAEGKVLAVRGAYVSEWNGVKGVNAGFGCSVDVAPDIDEANYLKEWFDQNSSQIAAASQSQLNR